MLTTLCVLTVHRLNFCRTGHVITITTTKTNNIITNTNQAQHNSLVVIPGGPGLPHDYLETLEGAAKDDRVVILFDPIGTGNSTALPADVAANAPGLLGTASLIAQVMCVIRL